MRAGAGVARYLAGRVAAALLVVWAAASVAFLVLHLLPGDPVQIMLGNGYQASPGMADRIRHDYGFDRPLAVQYARFLGRLLHGDLGTSYQQQRPVTAIIGEQLGPTLQLAAAATVLVVLVAGLLALATAGTGAGRGPLARVGRFGRSLVSGVELTAISLPSFWLGILLLTVFSFRLRLLPAAGEGGLAALLLPAVTLALPAAGLLSQVLRDGMQAAWQEPFTLTARSRGLSERAVRARHTLRHAALPALNLAGWFVGHLLGGAVLVETVFARPGLGKVALEAVTSRDIPVVLGVVMAAAAAFAVVSTVVDLLCLAVDPRLRVRRAAV
ncbi:ABC transporter permease [Actinacidiphila yeochonensis]|uniref:ABC transporter permease n=1 Tax=Actinacidiphila yeochonensis TaxID=89050 RepID=UPI00056408B4|nr:ABC transporter permease [Actinacidiphila yeochonensis]